ncbi:MAG: tetratricopeptide repeat protein [Flavobacteriaceae bacterium]|nr:tetratricopeptide repeat protein [Flavobacteriaceae bacterium]
MDHLTRLEELLNQANLDIKDGYYEAATNKLEDIINEDPNFGKAYNHLGYMYEAKFKEYEKAETLYKIAIEKSPNYPAVYYNYAVLLSTLGKYDELKVLLAKALLVPGITKATVHNEYGIMYEQLGDLDKAIESYREAGKLTLSGDVLNRVKASIERCKNKKEL